MAAASRRDACGICLLIRGFLGSTSAELDDALNADGRGFSACLLLYAYRRGNSHIPRQTLDVARLSEPLEPCSAASTARSCTLPSYSPG